MYTDEEDEVPSLADCLAASNLDSSPDKETEKDAATPAKKKAVPKRASASQKKTISEFSSDDEQIQTISEEKGSNGEFEPPAALKGGKKPSAVWRQQAAFGEQTEITSGSMKLFLDAKVD
ncbi:hypothetical protein C5167_014330 [Papaver somniferum]|uniref:Uncharacterized protein n=1 Tax=Papaver somniferum TaxID=3469 RepID=A0A4Y7J5Z0_PAPSO|nr:hypothetical protein C5167_014330 [Papaver somniferum]